MCLGYDRALYELHTQALEGDGVVVCTHCSDEDLKGLLNLQLTVMKGLKQRPRKSTLLTGPHLWPPQLPLSHSSEPSGMAPSKVAWALPHQTLNQENGA